MDVKHISKNIYFAKSNINKDHTNKIPMKKEVIYMDSDSIIFGHISIIDKIKSKIYDIKARLKKYKEDRMKGAMEIACGISASNQEVMDKILNIGRKKK